jgi:hypothetical protein
MAQSSSVAYNSGVNLVNIGIGVGTPFFGSGYSASLPVNPTVSYERGITDAISVGGQLSYASYKYSFSDGYIANNYSIKYSATYIGARASYHLSQLLSIPDKFDLYGGASVGYVVVGASDNQGNAAILGSAFGVGGFAGGKYYFSSSTAVYAELGYQSLSYLNIGIAFKF